MENTVGLVMMRPLATSTPATSSSVLLHSVFTCWSSWSAMALSTSLRMWERGPLGDLEAPHTGLQGGPVGTTLWSFLRPVSFGMKPLVEMTAD